METFKKITKRILLILRFLVATWCVIFGVYLSQYYGADADQGDPK